MKSLKDTLIHENKFLFEEEGDMCPRATKDVEYNTIKRDKAIESEQIQYGPANPSRANQDFWQEKADKWDISISEAQTMRCGNCKAFNVSRFIIDCMGPIAQRDIDQYDNVENLGEVPVLGYCQMHDFKCASTRTCNTWVHGGPAMKWGED